PTAVALRRAAAMAPFPPPQATSSTRRPGRTSTASQRSSCTICAAAPIFAQSPFDQACCWIWVTTWRSGASVIWLHYFKIRAPLPIHAPMAGWRNRLRARLVGASLVLALGVLCVAASSAAGMRSEKLGRHLCKTVKGGKFVAIPGFPGEKIDRRLIPDIRWMKRRDDIFITDGSSRDPVHAEAGEHPIGLATDIVPNASRGGTWNEIGELAH